MSRHPLKLSRFYVVVLCGSDVQCAPQNKGKPKNKGKEKVEWVGRLTVIHQLSSTGISAAAAAAAAGLNLR